MTTPATTILIADDHPLFEVALRLGIQQIAPDAVVHATASFAGLQALAQRHSSAELVLLDLMMPDVEGLAALQFLRNTHPQMRVAIISGITEPTWLRAAEALGAIAFIAKSTRPEVIQNILKALLGGASWWPASSMASLPDTPRSDLERRLDKLSRQELRILLQIRDGRLNKQIAHDLGIAESTVKTHITTLLRKFDLQSRTQAAVLAQQLLNTGLETQNPPT